MAIACIKNKISNLLFRYFRLNADVPIHAQQLLAYKIQSPIEKEAIAGLKVNS